jgi:hypothetical protein
MEKGEAISYWQKGIFCIKLTKEPLKRELQDIALGIDPGSKREGYTIATKKSVVLNITTNTPDWVKPHVETRRNLRRARRYRKTPYRVCRGNRKVLSNKRMPPSTKARWGAKLRIIQQLMKILPITIINVEDIAAVSKKGKKKWNTSFSPLEVGKKWFYDQIESFAVKLLKTKGIETYRHRQLQGYQKAKNKLDYTWSAHNSDSHCLVEIALNNKIQPFYNLYKIEFLEYYRRQLHVQNYAKGAIRKPYGTTVSLGLSRGSVIKYKDKLGYLGGTSKNKVAVHSIITGKRVNQFVKLEDIKIMYITKRRVQFLPRLKPWVSLHKFS